MGILRDDGTPAKVGDWWWIENGQVHFEAPLPVPLPVPPSTNAVPNRLKGARINQEGDAV